MPPTIEDDLTQIDALEEFERRYPSESLRCDDHVGNYLCELLWQYDMKESVVSNEALLHSFYVGNIVGGRKQDVVAWFGLMKHLPLDTSDQQLRQWGYAPLIKE